MSFASNNVDKGPAVVDAALDLMRRLPPTNIVENLTSLTRLVPDIADELLCSVDLPLRSLTCPETDRLYLICDYNRDGNSYRSPHSNTYFPSLGDANAAFPSDRLRALEINANSVFDMYRRMYFEGGLSSVYFWDLEQGFASIVLIQKHVEKSEPSDPSGTWDSIHIFEITGDSKKQATYKLTSTILLFLQNPLDSTSHFSLNGSITRQLKSEMPISEGDGAHVSNMGKMVESMEGHLREVLTNVYFDRTLNILSKLRSPVDESNYASFRQGTSAASFIHGSTTQQNEIPASPVTGNFTNSDVMSRIAASGRRLI